MRPGATGLREDGDRGGEAADGVAAADRTELSGTEHPRHRSGAEQVTDNSGVVVGRAEQPPTTPVAREHERATSGAPGQQGPQVLVRAGRIPHLELHGRTYRRAVAHRDGAGGTIDAEHAPDEEVAALELVFGFVDDDTAVQALLGEMMVAG
jgi:hypothetical protein